MATVYTGQVVTARSPAPVPAAGAVPQLSMAADGDPLNAASIAQALKALADYATWATGPLAPIADYTKVAWFAQNPRGLMRGGFDHGGFPSGRLWSLRENWVGAQGIINATGSGYLPGLLWYYVNVSGTTPKSTLQGSNPAAGALTSNSLSIQGGAALADLMDVGTFFAHMVCTADVDAMCEFDVLASSGGSGRFVGGFTDPIGTTVINSIAAGAYFRRQPGTTNWQCVTGDGTTNNVLTTSLAPGTPQHMRIQLQGANASDDGTARALFWINGTLIANLTANLPTAVPSLLGTRFGVYQPAGGGSGSDGAQVACVNVEQASWAGSHFL